MPGKTAFDPFRTAFDEAKREFADALRRSVSISASQDFAFLVVKEWGKAINAKSDQPYDPKDTAMFDLNFDSLIAKLLVGEEYKIYYNEDAISDMKLDASALAPKLYRWKEMWKDLVDMKIDIYSTVGNIEFNVAFSAPTESSQNSSDEPPVPEQYPVERG